MSEIPSSLDATFHALSNSTRRGVLEALANGPRSVSQLAEPAEMALPSFMQHLRVLEDCGLIESIKVGRVRSIRLKTQGLKFTSEWLLSQVSTWDERLDRLAEYTKKLQNKESRDD